MELQISYSVCAEYRRQVIYGQIKTEIGQILRKLCEQKGIEIQETQACPDHIMLVSIPPLLRISSKEDIANDQISMKELIDPYFL